MKISEKSLKKERRITMNNNRNDKLEEIAKKIQQNTVEFSEIYEEVQDRSSLITISSIDNGDDMGLMTVGVAGDLDNIVTALLGAMRKNKSMEALIMIAATKNIMNRKKDLLTDLDDLFSALKGECNCPQCTADRLRKQKGN